MSDYEATAYLSLEKLKEKQQMEQDNLRAKIQQSFKATTHFSKELIELNKHISILVSVKEYDKAEKLKVKASSMEEIEQEHQLEKI